MTGRPRRVGWEPAFFEAFATRSRAAAARVAGISTRTVGRRMGEAAFRKRYWDIAREKLGG